MRLLVRASGYDQPSHYQPEVEEIKCGRPAEIGGKPKCKWSPWNKDFEVLGKASGGSEPAATLQELIDVIKKQKDGSIDELRILGHSNDRYFALSGQVVADDVIFHKHDAIIGDIPPFTTMQADFRRLRSKFAAKGVVTLAGCGSGGTGASLLKLASEAFLCCVRGFQRPIQYNYEFSFNKDRSQQLRKGVYVIGPTHQITIRGRVSYSQASDTFADLGDLFQTTSLYKTSAWDLNSDALSCEGQTVFNAAARVNRSAIDGRLAAFEVGWRILKLWFPQDVGSVHGVGYDETLRGLKVEFEGTKVSITVGKPYVESFGVQTLGPRLDEMRRALQCVKNGKGCTILMP